MKNHKHSRLAVLIALFFVFISCTANSKITGSESSENEQVIMLCLIEYDLSQLEYKSVQGVELFLNTEEKTKNIKIPRSYLPKENGKYFKFICTTGNFGQYEIFYRKNTAITTTDDFITMTGELKVKTAEHDNVLLRVNASSEGIVCLGKIKVKYEGGKKEDGTIDYTYEFEKHYNDTIAIQAFSEAHTELFDKYKEQVYYFNK